MKRLLYLFLLLVMQLAFINMVFKDISTEDKTPVKHQQDTIETIHQTQSTLLVKK